MITAREKQLVVDAAKAAMHTEIDERFRELEKRLEALETPADKTAPKSTRAKAA